MNERIILKFLEFGPEKAQRMLSAAADFATSKPDGPVGWRAGTVYRGRYGTFLARWTATRTVVVEELEPKEAAGG